MTWDFVPSGLLALLAPGGLRGALADAAAASARPSGWSVAALTVLIAAGVAGRWLWKLWRRPWAPCRRCGGSGKNAGSTGKRYGRCGRCGGSGQRAVLGAGLFHRGLAAARKRRS